jgi:hypothetical protein
MMTLLSFKSFFELENYIDISYKSFILKEKVKIIPIF